MSMTATKERPILFSGPMVNAIMRGEKTQTRRAIKPQPANGCRYEINGAMNAALHVSGQWGNHPTDPIRFVPPTPKSEDHRLPCPYGQPGDRLWVRETWQSVPYGPHRDWPGCPDTRPHGVCESNRATVVIWRADGEMPGPEIWRPSIFMPRWASRLTLEITGVRVERLQAISEEDAAAEGCDGGDPIGYPVVCPYARQYERLWEEINGAGSWNANPWVWVIEFRKIDAQGVSS